MTATDTALTLTLPAAADSLAPEHLAPELLARVYQASEPGVRARLLETLLRPMGPLALLAVSGGVFAALRKRNGWDSLHVTPDDTARIGASQVQDLAAFAMQSAPQVLAQVADLLDDQPTVLAGVGALLVLQLLRLGARTRRRWWQRR